MSQQRPLRRLPVIADQALATAEDDPLLLLRGGRFARWFAVFLGTIGLFWIIGAQVSASDPEGSIVLVHGDLAKEDGAPRMFAALDARAFGGETPPPAGVEELPARGATPPPASVEDLPAQGTAPPPAGVEDLPARGSIAAEASSPGAASDDNVVHSIDRFGRKRTKTGALVLEDEGGDGSAGLGLTDSQRDAFAGGGFFDVEAFDDVKVVKRKAYVHLMPGIPNEAFFGAAVLILLLSFVGFERYGKERDPRSRTRDYWRFELTRWPWLRRVMKSRWFQPAVQLPVVIGFVAVIVIGLIGSQEPGRNLAPVLTWNIWWIGLIFLVLFAGNLWCYMCPWTAIPDWVMRRSLTKVRAIASLGKKYPRFRLWMWPAIVLFGFVTWLEIIFDAANRPWLTSLFGIFMVVLSWGLLVVYERKAMCRYVCFVGRVSGQYSMMGMLELRRRDPEVCRTCKTKDCYRGSEEGYPCPTHEFMGAMNENQYCTLCTECVKSCPHDNIALNVRASGADLLFPHRSKIDEAYMAILVFIVSAFHGAAMIPLWMEWENSLRGGMIDLQQALFGAEVLGFAGSHGGTLTFTLMMLGCIILPGLAYLGLCAAMWACSGRRDIGVRTLFIRFAYTLLPIALFYHLAHNAVHVFWEWSKIRRLISDPLGWGYDIFGTARAPLTALWSPESIWYLQVLLVIIGHVYGIYVARREALRLYRGDTRASLRVHLVMMVGMVLMSLLSLWLLAQPMFMRTADI